MLSFVDDVLRKVWVYFLKEKNKVLPYSCGGRLLSRSTRARRLRIDNGLEFCSEEFNNFYKDARIVHHRMVVGTPQQNGVGE